VSYEKRGYVLVKNTIPVIGYNDVEFTLVYELHDLLVLGNNGCQEPWSKKAELDDKDL
jgi:hypothetical protein